MESVEDTGSACVKHSAGVAEISFWCLTPVSHFVKATL